jgi:hypothetical protein
MYTKQEISRQKQAFWTAFGQYMQPVYSADGLKINWTNYKTGINGLYFRMDVDINNATIAIVLAQDDAEIRKSYYNRFMRLKHILYETLGEEWHWQPDITDAFGKLTSRIGTELHNGNICRTEDWPQIISFFKPRTIALDEFWSLIRDGFEHL